MSKVQTLRAFVRQRLSAAAEEIFELFERTIAEYEEQLCRQHKLLDAVFKPQVRLHRADVQLLLDPPEQQEWSSSLDQEDPELPHIKEEQEELWSSQEGEQLGGLEEAEIIKFTFTPVPVKSEEEEEEDDDVQLLLVSKEEDPPEQQEWSSSLDQEDPELPHIKEEQEELWSSQEGEQLGGLEEAQIKFTPVPVKSEEEEDEEEKPQSSQLHQRPTEADGEDCGGPEPARNSDPETHLQPQTEDGTENHFDPQSKVKNSKNVSREAQLHRNLLRNTRFNACEKPFSCSECGKGFSKNSELKSHKRVHTGEKPFSCSLCNKRFTQKTGLLYHMKTHTGEKPFSCSVCGKRFGQKIHLRNHVKSHSGEKPYSCSLCTKCFTRLEHLQLHMRTHTGEKPFSCSSCGKRFTWRYQIKRHRCGGDASQPQEQGSSQEGEQLGGLEEAQIKFTPVPVKSEEEEEDDEEKPQSSQLHQRQTRTEAGGPEPARNSDPETHLQPQTEDGIENSVKSELEAGNDGESAFEAHVGVNVSRSNRFNSCEKPYFCSECGKRFSKNSKLKRHMKIHTGEKPFSCSLCNKRFAEKSGLHHHLKTHTGEKPYSCSICGNKFGHKSTLQNHLKCHTGEKPYSCSLCTKCFTRLEHLQSHMRTHTGEKPFSCSSCGKRFTWRYQIKNHRCGGDTSQPQEQGSSQEGEQLGGLEEAQIKFTPVPVKSEEEEQDDEEKPQSSQLHQRQTRTEAGGPEPAKNSDPDCVESHGITYNLLIGQF